MFLLLPVWLLAGWAGFARPAMATASTQSAEQKQETKVSKVEAAPVAAIQLQAPQGDLWLPSLPEPSYVLVPADHDVLPLRACRMRPVPDFAQRYTRTLIASRAP